jgi:hypothetical protein
MKKTDKKIEKRLEERRKSLENQPPVPQPVMGQKIYVPSSLYVYRGQDDFAGGLATINKIEKSTFLPEDHYNYLSVGIVERPGTLYNWRPLLERQEELKGIYEGQIAHPDPDDRPEFNDENADWR